MEVQNGIEVYDLRAEKPFLPLKPKTHPKAASCYGFKIIEVAGTRRWAEATEEDYRRAEAQRLGISASQVAVKESDCYCIIDPDFEDPTCIRKCPLGSHCTLMHDSRSNLWYCTCR